MLLAEIVTRANKVAKRVVEIIFQTVSLLLGKCLLSCLKVYAVIRPKTLSVAVASGEEQLRSRRPEVRGCGNSTSFSKWMNDDNDNAALIVSVDSQLLCCCELTQLKRDQITRKESRLTKFV